VKDVNTIGEEPEVMSPLKPRKDFTSGGGEEGTLSERHRTWRGDGRIREGGK
jgi:hypothetical protein